jgi:ribose/xylose/arabinose/galactoside ABC-type transport system permease subunit
MQQVAVVGILAAAQTLVVLTAGIDLAIGVIMVFAFVIMGNLVLSDGSPGDFAVPAVLALLAGFALAGLLRVRERQPRGAARLPPFIVTLGTWNIIMAICLIYSANETMREADLTAQTQLLHIFGQNFRIGPAVVTYGVVAMILLYVALWFMLNHTAFGRHIYAVGDDPEAAELAGISTKKVLIAVYTLAGVIAGLRGLGLDRAQRLDLALDGGDRLQPAGHHRDGDRGHLALRRARLDPGRAVRDADRRHHVDGPEHDERGPAVEGVADRRADHRRRRRRPVDPQGLG